MNRRPKPEKRGARRRFPSGYRKIMVEGGWTFYFKIGDRFTEIRHDDHKIVIANWTLKGMTKELYLSTRWTHGTAEFRDRPKGYKGPWGCECIKCDCGESHIRYSHVVYPRDILRAVKGWTIN